MRKYTKKEIKKTINAGIAKDITDYSFSEMKEWRKCRNLEKVGYVPGTYGIAAGMVQDRNTGELFAITKRNTALLSIF